MKDKLSRYAKHFDGSIRVRSGRIQQGSFQRGDFGDFEMVGFILNLK